jgi:hypothetical protein
MRVFDCDRCGVLNKRHLVNSNRSRNVLDGLLAHVFEAKTEFIADLVMDSA